MELINEIVKKNNLQLYEEVKKEVAYIREELAGACDEAIRDSIFDILDEQVNLIMFPIKDDDFCGFICEYKGEKFIYINTYLPLEKQIFAAGHELYHLIRGADEGTELLKSSILNEEENIEIEDKLANLFSALLLVPKESLLKQLDLLKINNYKDLTIKKILKLMNTFAVPYKTIILRLYEIEILSETKTKKWLEVEDRDTDRGVLYEIKKHQIGEKWQQRTKTVKLSNLKALIIDNGEEELLPKSRIDSDLNYVNELIKEADRLK